MRLASEQLDFEEAARIRDRIRALERKTGATARPRAVRKRAPVPGG